MKPMLAVKCEDIKTLRFPVLCSPKLDGIRCCIVEDEAVTRSLKPIPNTECYEHLSNADLTGLDGELIQGKPVDASAYLDTVSGVMSEDTSADDIHFWVFDDFTDPTMPFYKRYTRASIRVDLLKSKGYRVCLVPHYECHTWEELEQYEQHFLSQGYEGAMVRDWNGPYKFGRSTLREGWLLKVKRFEDSEAIVIGVEELQRNNNVATVNELGNSHRSSHKAGMVAGGCLGALNVRDVKTNVEFSIGSGFTQAQREAMWTSRDKLIGKLVKYKYFPTGSKEKPRFPTFLGWRSKLDL